MKIDPNCPRCEHPYSEHVCYWSPCKGCPEGHPSIHKTIIESEEWDAWGEENDKRMSEYSENNQTEFFNICESEECGQMSPGHWQSFVKFIRTM